MKETEFIKKWLPHEWDASPNFAIERLGEETAKERLTASLKESFDYCSNLEKAQRSFEYCQIEGSKASDYQFRVLETDLGTLVGSIRFLGGDLSKPFVYVVHKGFALDSIESIQYLSAFLKKEYAVFQPQRIRWFSPRLESDLIEAHSQISGDLMVITQFIDHLQAQEFPAHFDRIHLKVATSLGWYEPYEKSYQAILNDWRGYEEMGQITTREVFQELIDKQLAFEVFVDKQWAGVIAVAEESFKLIKGYEVYEELLLKSFRGKRLAPAVQRHMIEQLNAADLSMLFGTIHYGNVPSWKTAFKVGRQLAGMYVFCSV